MITESTANPNEAPEKRAVPVKTGRYEDRVIEVELGHSVHAILEIIAVERGCKVEELLLFREGEDEPLAEFVIVEVDYPHHRRHHVHHVRDLKVTVYYQTSNHLREYKRSATVGEVLEWAIDEFKIDPAMASEFELAIHGQKTELPASEHIGHLANGHHELALDLLRGDIANGECA